jgi:hypothetical protein
MYRWGFRGASIRAAGSAAAVCYGVRVDLETSSLVASIIVSSIGFVVFVYGKRQQRVPQIVVGLLLMGFPYLVPGVLLMAGIAALLLVGLWAAIRFGL